MIQVQDDGLDQGIDTNAPGTAHPDILGRIAGIFNATSDPLGDSGDGHGQINAGIIMGNATVGTTDPAGYLLGQGMAPEAQVYATKIFENGGSFFIGANSFTDLARAAQNAGAQGATIYYGRGSGVRERLGLLGLAIEVEKEVINVVVSTDQVDRIFERMYIEGNLDAPGMGIMYVTPLDKAATYIPHEIVEEIAGKGLAKKR